MDLRSVQDLDESARKLIECSSEARGRAYSPYSNFDVGAAMKFVDGTIVTGSNVENSSYGLTICAERTALVKAVSNGQAMQLEAVAVSALTNAQLISPCGACRQFISEFNPSAKVYLHNPRTNLVGVTTMTHLLPLCYDHKAEKQ